MAEEFQKDKNKQEALKNIWRDPSILFGGEWRYSSNSWYYKRGDLGGDGCVHLLADNLNDFTAVTVHFNHGYRGALGYKPGEWVAVLTYAMNKLGANFFGTLLELSQMYGFTLDLSGDARKSIARDKLAKACAAALLEYARTHPNGKAETYVREVRGLAYDSHFAELTDDSLKFMHDSLKAQGLKYEQKDVELLGLKHDFVKEGYNCVIPYITNGAVQGFMFRNVNPNYKGKKIQYSTGSGWMDGYCEHLRCGTAREGSLAVVCEGVIDAIRLMQAGVTNVVAMGGATMNTATTSLMKNNHITDIVYIPDREYLQTGERRTDLIEQAVKKFREAEINGEKVVRRLYIADLPAPDGNLNGAKVDIDDFGRKHGNEALLDVIENGNVSAWEWQMNLLYTRRNTLLTGQVQDEIDSLYNALSPYERERFKAYLVNEGAGMWESYGITRQALTDRDEWAKVKKYYAGVSDLSGELARAVERHASPSAIAKIVGKLTETQGSNDRDEWERQMHRSWGDFIEMTRNKPDPFRTKWQLGWPATKDKKGNKLPGDAIFKPFTSVQFYPANITVICAATSHGKTAFMFQSAIDMLKAKPDAVVLYISSEQSEQELLMRAFNSWLDIGTTDEGVETINGKSVACFRTDWRTRSLEAAITDAAPPIIYTENLETEARWEELKERVKAKAAEYSTDIAPRLCAIRTNSTAESIEANITHYCEEFRRQGVEVAAAFIDYIQLLDSDERTHSRHDEMKDICRVLNRCADTTGLALIVGAQLNRDAMNGNYKSGGGFDSITLSNIGEGADIERIAHDVYMLWNTNHTNTSTYIPEPDAEELKFQNLKERSRRIFTSTGLIEDCMYIEQMKARSGKNKGWGLFPFDGEGNKIGELDRAKALAHILNPAKTKQ